MPDLPDSVDAGEVRDADTVELVASARIDDECVWGEGEKAGKVYTGLRASPHSTTCRAGRGSQGITVIDQLCSGSPLLPPAEDHGSGGQLRVIGVGSRRS